MIKKISTTEKWVRSFNRHITKGTWMAKTYVGRCSISCHGGSMNLKEETLVYTCAHLHKIQNADDREH
jgi:hypothetical protein